jgi:tetratricopeptide (TPR) repeat protein
MDKLLDPRAHLESGFAAAKRDDWARAIAHLRVAVAAAPQVAEGWMHFGSALQHVGRLDDAERVARQALALGPNLVGAHNVLALIDIDRTRFDQAIVHARRAIELDPRYAGSWVNLGVAQSGARREDEAAASLARALELDPASALAHYNLGALRHAQGRHGDAMRHYREAIRLDPNHRPAHANLGLALFTTGAFEEAWREYRWRGERAQFEKMLRREGRPRVAVHAEQGLGDLLFFLRFAAPLRDSGATLDFAGDARLHGMLARTGLFEALAPRLAELPEGDRDVVLAGDLPLEVPGLAASTPAPLALAPEARRAADVRSRLEALGPPPYIALAWRSGEPRAGRVVNLFKQVPPEALGAALRGVKATWIAVQRDPSREDLERISKSLGAPVHDWSAINTDLEEALAVMAAVDDYAGVSSTLVHLRAGSGKGARLLVPFPPEWRWMESGETSPWFPRATVYRQAPGGDWRAALERLAADQRDQGGAVPGSMP